MVRRMRSVLKSDLPRGTLQVTVFIPSKDRSGRRINQRRWARATLDLLGLLFRGATAFPPGEGVWRDDSRGGRLLRERTVMVTSYTSPADHTPDAVARLSEFLHRFGRDANQGEVGVVIGDQYFGITEYSLAGVRK